MQTSCFLVLQYLNSITSITGGIVGSDFLFSQILASSEQISFSLVFFRKRVSGSRQIYSFVSKESRNTLLLLNLKSSFNYFKVTEKGFCLKFAMVKVKETNL